MSSIQQSKKQSQLQVEAAHFLQRAVQQHTHDDDNDFESKNGSFDNAINVNDENVMPVVTDIVSNMTTTKTKLSAADSTITTDFMKNSSNDTDDTKKGSRGMIQSLHNIQLSLVCTLCQNVYNEPVTIQCGHTFCCLCIDRYTDNNWYCPIKTCQMPVTMKGSRVGAKFRRVNPSMETMVQSWTNICQAMMKAEDFWWQGSVGTDDKNDNLNDITATSSSSRTQYDDHDDRNDVNDDDEEIIDLQPPRGKNSFSPCCTATTDNNNNQLDEEDQHSYLSTMDDDKENDERDEKIRNALLVNDADNDEFFFTA